MTASTHPVYCAPARCEDTGSDVVHASDALVVDALDGAVTTRMVRCDERGPGDVVFEHPSEARLAIPGGTAHLTLDGVRELRAALARVEACMAEEARRAAR